VLEEIGRLLRAGLSVEGAIGEVARRDAGPVADDLRAMQRRLMGGAALSAALRAWQRASTEPVVALPVVALLAAAESGGPRSWAVDRVASTLRERQLLEGELRAQAGQARLSALVVGLAPLGFAVLVLAVDPQILRFFSSAPGALCLVVGLAVNGLGAGWMARIVRSVG
jgi:tight adherence protein B